VILEAGTSVKRPDKLLPNVVTSFNEEGYKRYGQRFIESFLRFWPAGVRLTVFYEGEGFEFTHGISWHPIEEVPHLTEFMDNLRFPIMRGVIGTQYDINYDARHARKAFIEMHAMRKYGGKVFWIDADTVTHTPVPEWLLDQLLPDDALCCYLGRDGWYFTETGFIGFNGNHPHASRFAKNYLNVFLSGAIFSQQYWHDCGGFDAIRQVFGNGPEFVDIASDVPRGTMHPQVNTILGRYMTHFKGNRKDDLELRPGDIVEPRRIMVAQ